MAIDLSRRDFLGGAAGLALASLTGCSDKGILRPRSKATGQPFRFVHLTDIHVEPELAAAEGFAKALRAVEALRPRPDFILTGGDLVFDVCEADATRADALFKLFNRVVADHTSIPLHHTCGNHDVFGWSTKTSVTPSSPGYGKAMVRDALKLADTHYSFDHKGWRFFVLDNILHTEDPRGYEGGLDPAQLEWLTAELRRTPADMPIVTCEHIPLVSASPFAFENYRQPEGWMLPNALVCKDAVERIQLYATRRVRLALSGHLHQLDRVEMRGTTYLCGGAVCGGWWRGDHRGLQEGFGIVDLRPDGTFDYAYHDYGWEART